jgi:hypothetical protein
MGKLLLIGVLATIGVVIGRRELPSLKRYMKITQM